MVRGQPALQAGLADDHRRVRIGDADFRDAHNLADLADFRRKVGGCEAETEAQKKVPPPIRLMA